MQSDTPPKSYRCPNCALEVPAEDAVRKCPACGTAMALTEAERLDEREGA